MHAKVPKLKVGKHHCGAQYEAGNKVNIPNCWAEELNKGQQCRTKTLPLVVCQIVVVVYVVPALLQLVRHRNYLRVVLEWVVLVFAPRHPEFYQFCQVAAVEVVMPLQRTRVAEAPLFEGDKHRFVQVGTSLGQ